MTDILSTLVNLTAFGTADAFTFPTELPNLKSLSVTWSDKSADFFTKCPNLTALLLTGDYSVSNDVWEIREWSFLMDLELELVRIHSKHSEALGYLQSLENLILNSCSVDCGWLNLGISLSKTPVNRLILFQIIFGKTEESDLRKNLQVQYFRNHSPKEHQNPGNNSQNNSSYFVLTLCICIVGMILFYVFNHPLE